MCSFLINLQIDVSIHSPIFLLYIWDETCIPYSKQIIFKLKQYDSYVVFVLNSYFHFFCFSMLRFQVFVHSCVCVDCVQEINCVRVCYIQDSMQWSLTVKSLRNRDRSFGLTTRPLFDCWTAFEFETDRGSNLRAKVASLWRLAWLPG
jgi:hypothetical protein